MPCGNSGSLGGEGRDGCGPKRRSHRPRGAAAPGGAGRGGPGRAGEGRQPPRFAAGERAMESGGALNGSAVAATAGRFAAAGTAALGSLMVLLIAVTVAGNALVMLAFVADSSLRTQNNFFLLNLAISDFLVGKVQPRRGVQRTPRRCPGTAPQGELSGGLLPPARLRWGPSVRGSVRPWVRPSPRHPVPEAGENGAAAAGRGERPDPAPAGPPGRFVVGGGDTHTHTTAVQSPAS